eukprot:5187863-Alexandrium_andersonii.AAC.1
MIQGVLERHGVSPFVVAPLLQYVADRVLSVQGLRERLRPGGLNGPLYPGGPLRPEELDVLFQGQADRAAHR